MVLLLEGGRAFCLVRGLAVEGFEEDGVLGGLLVVVDGDEEDLAGEAGEGGGVVLAVNLGDGGIGRLVVLELDDDGGAGGAMEGDEDHVGEAFASRQLTKYLVVGSGGVVGEADGAGHRVLVVVLEDGGSLEAVSVEGAGDLVGVQ